MKDSLGGTVIEYFINFQAKTLMFVNISPVEYNLEETQTSLYYARLIY